MLKNKTGYGLPPIYFDKIIGNKSLVNLKSGTPLTKNILKKIN